MATDPGENFGPAAFPDSVPWWPEPGDPGDHSEDPGDNFGPAAFEEFQTPATGATAGTPGVFTPPGSDSPDDLAELQDSGVVASPATAWTTGQRVVLGDASTAYWNGTAWVAGQPAAAVAVTEANTKAEIVEWLLDHGVDLSESALNALTKAELLELVADVLDDDDGV
jgi:hypothetical protein